MQATKTNTRKWDIASFVHRTRFAGNESARRLCTNPLDELDTINHYCWNGSKNLGEKLRVLTLGDHSFGDESIFLAVQLFGTASTVVHYDLSTAAIEEAKKQAEKYKVAERIHFVNGSFENFLETCVSAGATFDYIRLCGLFMDADEFQRELPAVSRLANEDTVFGFSVFGKYGIEPYKQMQEIRKCLCGDNPGIKVEIDRLKEYFTFLNKKNWTSLAYENLLEAIRTTKDVAFAEYFLRDVDSGLSVPEIYSLLEENSLDLCHFSRSNRVFLQPWFAQRNKELLALFQSLPKKNTQAIAEIAWGKVPVHTFWAKKGLSLKADASDPDFVPFYNPFAAAEKNWKQKFASAAENDTPEIIVALGDEDTYTIPIPWNKATRLFVSLIDGQRTLGEIVMMIREMINGTVKTEDIFAQCTKLLLATELEDIFMLRHRSVSPLPFSKR